MPDHLPRAIPVVADGVGDTAPDTGTVLPRSKSWGEGPVAKFGANALRVRALQLLTRRDYSRTGLQAKLAPQAESQEELTAVLDALQAEHLLSDCRYATQRVATRGRRYGDARLRQELKQQGVSDTDIAAALPEAGDETERCRAIWTRKFGQPPKTAEERAKQMRFLQYRGFSGDAIRRALQGGEE